MIKILVLFAIVILSGLLGILLSSHKKQRAKTYEEFYEFNEKLILNIKYGRQKLREISSSYSSVGRAFDGEEVLYGEDAEFIREYVRSVGTSDAQSQINFLSGKSEQLKKLMEESRCDYRKYSSLYIKICLLAGVLVAVLLA